MKIVLAVLVLTGYIYCAKLPPDFKKCNRKDPDFEKCVFEAAQDGLARVTKDYPKINLKSFDPVEITELKIDAGAQGVVNVVQNFKDCKLFGLNTGKLYEFRFDFDKKVLRFGGTVEEVKKLCQYELNGKVLLLPIVGTGASTIILKNVNITGVLDYEVLPKKEKSYINFNHHKFTLDPQEVFFNFENLFNGDKALGDNINKVLNENNKEVYADVRRGYEESFGAILMQVLNGFFSKVSMEEAFD